MNDIDIIKKAVSKKHRCDPVHEAIERVDIELDSLRKTLSEVDKTINTMFASRISIANALRPIKDE